MAGPLTGIRVFELASFISGPYAGMLLGDLGADVVKLELPGIGDPFRRWSEREGEMLQQVAAYNRGKRSVICDVGTEGGRAVLLRLAAGADVLVESFRPVTMDRYGVGWDALRATNPRLVYCSVTGMGPSGPYRDRPTYDAIGQALPDSGARLPTSPIPSRWGRPYPISSPVSSPRMAFSARSSPGASVASASTSRQACSSQGSRSWSSR